MEEGREMNMRRRGRPWRAFGVVFRRAVMILCAAIVLSPLSCTETQPEPQKAPPPVLTETAQKPVEPLVATIMTPRGPESIYEGDSLSFSGRARGGESPYTFRWNFSGAASPIEKADAGEITFERPGVYEIIFEVMDAREAVARDTLAVEVIEDTSPVARIDVPAEALVTIREGGTLDFAGSALGGNGPVSFEWDFGQGSKTASGMRVDKVAFPDSGVFTVTLTARDADGDTGKSTVVVEVTKNVPIASIIEPSSAREIFEGRSVRFSGQAREGNGPFTFSWDFGGGAPPSASREPGDVVFTKPGLYEVTFTVKDVHGDAHSAFTTVSVLQDTKPVVEILSPALPVSILQGRGIEFLARVTGGDEPVEARWDFQGAAPETTQMNPGLVTFPVPGIYQTSFRATDASGDTAEATVQVTVVEDTVPEAAIIDLPEEILITEKGKVLFRGAVSGGNEPLSFLWRFGGAAPDVQAQDAEEIEFKTIGVFPVSFTVTDSDGDTAAASVTVKVAEDTKPVAAMEKPEEDVEIFEGESVLFRGSARDGNLPLRYRWDFKGGAKNAKVQNPGEVVFKKAGVYEVVFTVTDDNGDTDSVKRIVSVIRSSWASVSGGWSHSAGLKTDGTLWAWGLNSYGQLGNGGSASCRTPVMVGKGTNWAKVVVGGAHTLALENDGALWAWGANGTGQLGIGSNQNAHNPVRVMPDSRWKEIAAGKSHSLGIQVDGSLWAWGRNAEGQLGDGTRTGCNVPMPVGSEKDWRHVAAGEAHSIAVKEDGSLWAWGSNELGQVGDGGQSDSLSPKRIGGEEDVWIAVAAGRWHTLAIRSDGSLWAWGANIWGQLGDGTKVYKVLPVRVGEDTNWKMVSAGEYHSLALKNDGTLWSWGWNAFGQLGIGMTHDRKHPSCIGFDTNWSFVSAGDHHSMAVKQNGTLWGWGYNGYGQVGDNTSEDRDAPVLLRPPKKKIAPFGISLPGTGDEDEEENGRK